MVCRDFERVLFSNFYKIKFAKIEIFDLTFKHPHALMPQSRYPHFLGRVHVVVSQSGYLGDLSVFRGSGTIFRNCVNPHGVNTR